MFLVIRLLGTDYSPSHEKSEGMQTYGEDRACIVTALLAVYSK